MSAHRVTPEGDDARDAALMTRIRNGNAAALKTLFGLYHGRLRDFAYLTVNDADLARDVAQDVFVYVWEHAASFRGTGTVRGYLYRAARHRALNVVKHERAQARLRDANPSWTIDAPAPELADARVVEGEFATALRDVLESLTPRVREIFLMNRVHGMSYADIAAALDLSVPTVKSQVSRAARAIAAKLELLR